MTRCSVGEKSRPSIRVWNLPTPPNKVSMTPNTSEGSHTVPAVSLPPQAGTHRILHIHRNVPGVLGQINSRLSKGGFNITSQYLKTNDEIGYVILDVDHKISQEAFDILKDIKGTVRARLVY